MTKNKSKKLGAFVNYPDKEVASMEKDCFVIQVGSDCFEINGKIRFSAEAAAMYEKKIQGELLDSIDGGDEEEQSDAHKLLMTVRIYPFRFN